MNLKDLVKGLASGDELKARELQKDYFENLKDSKEDKED